jgi:MFS transporter, CP family, cyanate transporter
VGAVALIALVGFQLRSVILGVPPVLPMVRDELHLSFTAAGVLTAVPVLCLGAAAIPGALLVNRFGARSIVGAGTLALGVAALLRLAPPVPAALFCFSALMALGAAVAQPGVSVVVRAWFPGAVQRASTVFTSALGLGGLAGATLTIHLAAQVGWRGTFVGWGALALAAGLFWLLMAPGRRAEHQPQPSGLGALARDPAVWHVAAIFGAQSMIFYAATTWIPFQLRPAGPGYLSLVLLVLNLANVPVGLTLVALPWPWATSRPFYALSGALLLAGTGAFALGWTGTAWLWALLIGIGGSMGFAGAMALPALLSRRPAEIAGYAALVLTVGYAISFLGPFLGGLLLDRTHLTTSPFWPMVAVSAGMVVLGLRLPRRGDERVEGRS